LLLAELGNEEECDPSAPEAAPIQPPPERNSSSAEQPQALFERVWREHEQYLLKVCLRRLEDVSDAEDALATVALIIFEKLPTVHGRVLNLRAWLVQVAVNYCVDVQRRRQRQRRIFVSEPPEDRAELLPPSDAPTPDQELLEQQLWAMAHSLIKALPAMLQDVAEPYFLRHLSYPEIASQLGLTQDNVRKRIQKARAILWQQFLPHLE
jgi:RNA polymerase sigma factor (sigma-70 family)